LNDEARSIWWIRLSDPAEMAGQAEMTGAQNEFIAIMASLRVCDFFEFARFFGA
jgi:hypothetical protein